MPIVFVHGVNTRANAGYEKSEKARNGFLREIVSPVLGLSPDDTYIASPYWGGDGVKFAWNMAALPEYAIAYEQFGAEVDDALQIADLIERPELEGGLVEHARRDFAATVDLVYGAALAVASDEQTARGLAKSYMLAADYADAHPSPDWVDNVSDANFAGQLVYWSEGDGYEGFGGDGILQSLGEGVSRLVNALSAAGTDVAWRLNRKNLNARFTRFAGDAFVYLAKRGSERTPGPIVEIVLQALREADAHRNAADAKLIVIAHSFGGEIIYDILTRFAPDLRVDCLVTVGSQVALFEEMKLYLASDSAVPARGRAKVPRPPNLKRWLNVFDLNDVLSFRAGPVFADTEDYCYETGFGALDAHGGYFNRPSFYRRLAARLMA
jgi:hypothetical protein